MPGFTENKKGDISRYLLPQDEQNAFLTSRHAPFFLFALTTNQTCSFEFLLAPPVLRRGANS
jgi:hypothetical protein